jgi:hypothetical protein
VPARPAARAIAGLLALIGTLCLASDGAWRAAVVLPLQRGLAIPTWTRNGYADPSLGRDFRQVLDVGADWVQLTPTQYQDDPHASRIGPTEQTVDDADLEGAIRVAHNAGLRVLLKPNVDVTGSPGNQGNISPRNARAWFASYTPVILHYADIAERLKVEELSVGTELAGLSADRRAWSELVHTVRQHYTGILLYSASFGEYRKVTFWDLLDVIGVNAYWPLARRPTRDASLLARAWTPVVQELALFAAAHHRQIVFTEAGYISARGTTTKPYSWTVSRTPDQEEQAAAYQALLSAFQAQQWWGGVYWWVWVALPDATGNDELDFSARGKAAERVLRQWWR